MKTPQFVRNLILSIFTFFIYISAYSQTLIKDFHTGKNQGSNIKILESVNNQLLFCAESNGIYSRLWKTDGTKEGTSIVHPLFYSYNGYETFRSPDFAFLFRNKLYLKFTAANKPEYWETDGTLAGTKLSNPLGENCTTSSEFLKINNSVFFRCGRTFYKDDGTEYSLENTNFIFPYWSTAIAEWNNKLIVSNNFYHLYITDTTTYGVKEITNPDVKLHNNEAIGIDSLIFFSGADNELWCYSDKGDSSYMVKKFSSNSPERFISINGKVIFSVGTSTYLSDGTSEGTIPLNFHIYPSENYPYYIKYKNRLFFSAQDGIHGYELWETDGSLEGTKMVKDVFIGDKFSGSWPDCFVEFNGEIYFDASNGEQNGIWKSDGTAEGTKQVLFKGGVTSFKVSNNMLYAVYNDVLHGAELWVTDGTEQGFHMVRDINPNPYMATRILGKIDNKLIIYSFANDTSYLFNSDGTTDGTSIYHKAYAHKPALRIPTIKLGEKLFFKGINEVLWTTDGTSLGTIFNENISEPDNFFTFNNKLFFSALYSRKNVLHISSDDISTAKFFKWIEEPQSYIEYKNHFYFQANDNKEIWKSDGTVDGTNLLFKTESKYYSVSSLTTFNDLLYFIAPSETASAALWSSDGTIEGTQKYLDNEGQEIHWPGSLTVFNSSLFFSDSEGFKRLDVNTNQLIRIGNKANFMIVQGNKMYYNSYTIPNEYEPWCSDGTVEGTYQITNQNGNLSSNPHDFIGFGSKIYFNLFDQTHGRELWVSDGTEGNAKLFFDADSGFSSGHPSNFTIFKDGLYFLADDGMHGNNLYKITGSATNNIALNSIQKPQLLLYPNPTECCFKVVSGLNCTSTKTIVVFNTIGEKVLEKQFDSKEITIDLSNNAKGIYYVNVSCGDKQANEKIVIY